MKTIAFLFLCIFAAVPVLADEYFIYEKDTSLILDHSIYEADVDGNVVRCGSSTLREVKWNKLGIASTPTWVPGATTTNQLGVITLIDPEDQEVDYDVWIRKQKAMLKLLVEEINTLRALHGLPARTKQQVMTALKNEL